MCPIRALPEVFIKFFWLETYIIKRKEEAKALQSQDFCGKLTVKDGFLQCPTCRGNKKLLKVEPDTVAENLIVFCRFCKTEHRIDIRRGQCFKSRGQ